MWYVTKFENLRWEVTGCLEILKKENDWVERWWLDGEEILKIFGLGIVQGVVG